MKASVTAIAVFYPWWFCTSSVSSSISFGSFDTDNLTDESGVTAVGQKNVPWKTLLDVFYKHQLTLVNCPAQVSAPGTNFQLRHLNADELRALVVPFLKEHMGKHYAAEGPDDMQSGTITVPPSSFEFKKWTEGT